MAASTSFFFFFHSGVSERAPSGGPPLHLLIEHWSGGSCLHAARLSGPPPQWPGSVEGKRTLSEQQTPEKRRHAQWRTRLCGEKTRCVNGRKPRDGFRGVFHHTGITNEVQCCSRGKRFIAIHCMEGSFSFDFDCV